MCNKLTGKWLLVISIITTGVPIWFTSYNYYSNSKILYLSIIITGFITMLSVLLTKIDIIKIMLAAISGFMVAFFIKFGIDIYSDPTSHSLLGLEVFVGGIFCFGAAVLGVVLGFAFKKILQLIKK